ncbi:MAG TPA: GtrA family protein [Bacteroidia bacterium]|nr:GtrA family protein [Bacteroidia bacterium]
MIQKILNNKVFRYFIAAGLATVVDVVVYFITYNYILFKQDFSITDVIVVSAPSISLVISFSCGLLTNFVISKYYVFTESNIRGRHQLMRYVMVALFILMLNYFCMSFLIKGLGWYPTVSRIASALSIGLLSFVIHKVFSFKVKKSD